MLTTFTIYNFNMLLKLFYFWRYYALWYTIFYEDQFLFCLTDKSLTVFSDQPTALTEMLLLCMMEYLKVTISFTLLQFFIFKSHTSRHTSVNLIHYRG